MCSVKQNTLSRLPQQFSPSSRTDSFGGIIETCQVCGKILSAELNATTDEAEQRLATPAKYLCARCATFAKLADCQRCHAVFAASKGPVAKLKLTPSEFSSYLATGLAGTECAELCEECRPCPVCGGRGLVSMPMGGARYDPGPGGSLAMQLVPCRCEVGQRRVELAQQEAALSQNRERAGKCRGCGMRLGLLRKLRRSTLCRECSSR
jgi:hypothetical protein